MKRSDSEASSNVSTIRLNPATRVVCRDAADDYAELLRPYYIEHQLFPPDQWPPGLSIMYTNLALVKHDEFPVEGSLNEFEKATLRGSIDDLCFRKYSIELNQILKPDHFFFRKERELKNENEFYAQQLGRLLNLPMPDALKKHLNIPQDDGQGLPTTGEVENALKQPQFFRSLQLRNLVVKQQSSVVSPSAAKMTIEPNVSHVAPQCDLQLPDQGDTERTCPTPEQLQEDSSNLVSIKMLIDGAPGVGKTTLTWKISKDWAAGKLFEEFKILIRLSLRGLPDNPKYIHEILPLGSGDQRRAVEKVLLESNGRSTFLILDGWDELDTSQREKGSLLNRLILGELLPQSTIIVTSRPYTSRWLQLPQLVPRHIELCGFTQDQVRSCIRNEYSSKEAAEKLIQLLEVRTDIFKLCYIPNNLSIVMHIFRTSRNSLPNTLTALYDLYVHSAKVRYVQNQYADPEAALGLENEAQFSPKVKELLSSLCVVAFSGLQRKFNMFVFKESEIKEFNPLLAEGANTLGLMTAYKYFTPTAMAKSFQFIHGTIQEFLASKAICMSSVLQQEEFVLRYINSTKFRMVLIFYAGQASSNLLESILQVPITYEGSLNVERFFLLLRMVYEAHNPHLCKVFAKSFPNRSLLLSHLVTTEMPTISDFDIHMLQYVLQHSSKQWKVIESHETDVEKLLSPLLSASSNLNIEELHMSASTSMGVFEIITHPSLQKLKSITFKLQNPLGEAAVSSLSNLCTLSHLQFECFTQESLESALRMASKCRCLEYLELKVAKKIRMNNYLNLSLTIPIERAHSFCLRCEGLNIMDEFVTSLSHELDVSTDIKELYFEECSFSPNQLCSIFNSLKSNCTVNTFHLSRSYSLKWNAKAVNALEQMISVNTSISDLKLMHCSLDALVANGIAKGINQNQKLASLNLASNRSIEKSDLILISIQAVPLRMLEEQSHSPIQILNLSECGLKSHMQLLANFISSSDCAIKQLDISNNRIDEEGSNVLFAALINNHTVQVLNMKGNPLWLKDGTIINRMITENTVLRELLLEGCGLHTPAIAGVADGIVKNSSLTSLHLGVSLKPTPKEGGCLIVVAVGNNTSLQKLSLTGYTFEEEGTRAIARVLTCNRTLACLHLNRCKLGSPKPLIGALYSNKSLQEIMLPSTNKFFQEVFLEYDQINYYRTKNKLPHLRLIESGSQIHIKPVHVK